MLKLSTPNISRYDTSPNKLHNYSFLLTFKYEKVAPHHELNTYAEVP